MFRVGGRELVNKYVGIQCFVETKPQKRGHMEGGFLSGFRWVPIGLLSGFLVGS